MVNGSISPYKALFLRRVYATWKGSVAQLPLVLVYHVSFARAIYTDSPLGVPWGAGGRFQAVRSKLHVQELISSTLQLLVMPKTSSSFAEVFFFAKKTKKTFGNLKDVFVFN